MSHLFLFFPSHLILLAQSRSRVRLCVILWTATRQAPLSMGFSRQEYWSGLPFSSPRDLPNLGIESWSLALQADSLPSESPGKPMKLLAQCLANSKYYYRIIFVKVTSWFSLSISKIAKQLSIQLLKSDFQIFALIILTSSPLTTI